MKRIVSIALLIAGAALLSGCPKKHNVVEPPTAGTQVPGSSNTTTGTEGASTSGRTLGGDAAAAANAMTSGPLAKRIIYFDFDKSEIKPEFADTVSAHARNLTSHPNLKMKLEGNTDERGTREYNIGLGERRAPAVRRALMLQGVAESQLTTVRIGAWNWCTSSDSPRFVRFDGLSRGAGAGAGGLREHAAGGGSGANQTARFGHAPDAHRAGGGQSKPARVVQSGRVHEGRFARHAQRCRRIDQQSRRGAQATAGPVCRPRPAHESPRVARRRPGELRRGRCRRRRRRRGLQRQGRVSERLRLIEG